MGTNLLHGHAADTGGGVVVDEQIHVVAPVGDTNLVGVGVVVIGTDVDGQTGIIAFEPDVGVSVVTGTFLHLGPRSPVDRNRYGEGYSGEAVGANVCTFVERQSDFFSVVSAEQGGIVTDEEGSGVGAIGEGHGGGHGEDFIVVLSGDVVGVRSGATLAANRHFEKLAVLIQGDSVAGDSSEVNALGLLTGHVFIVVVAGSEREAYESNGG